VTPRPTPRPPSSGCRSIVGRWSTSLSATATPSCAEVGLRVDVEADPHDLDGLVAAVRRALA
jgi:hypothetical protein